MDKAIESLTKSYPQVNDATVEKSEIHTNWENEKNKLTEAKNLAVDERKKLVAAIDARNYVAASDELNKDEQPIQEVSSAPVVGHDSSSDQLLQHIDGKNRSIMVLPAMIMLKTVYWTMILMWTNGMHNKIS